MYYFALFAIVNELLIYKDSRIRATFRQIQAHGEMRPLSDQGTRKLLFIRGIAGTKHRALRLYLTS
jgi:hypothetical protein